MCRFIQYNKKRYEPNRTERNRTEPKRRKMSFRFFVNMNDMKRFFEHFVWLSLFILFVGMLVWCHDKQEEGYVRKEADSIVEEQRGAVATLQFRIDSLQDEISSRETDIVSLMCDIDAYKRTRLPDLKHSTNDTIRLCDTIIVYQDSVIRWQTKSLDDCNEVVALQDSVIETKEVAIVRLQDLSETQAKEITRIKAERQTWWQRNKAWVGLAAGITVGVASTR